MLAKLFTLITGITPDDPYLNLYAGKTDKECELIRERLEHDETLYPTPTNDRTQSIHHGNHVHTVANDGSSERLTPATDHSQST